MYDLRFRGKQNQITLFQITDNKKKGHNIPSLGNNVWITNTWHVIQYLDSRTNHLNKTIKHTSPFSFKGFPMKEAFVYSKCCYRLPLVESNIIFYAVDKSINILL